MCYLQVVSIRGVVGIGSHIISELQKSPSQQQNNKPLGLISSLLSLHCFWPWHSTLFKKQPCK